MGTVSRRLKLCCFCVRPCTQHVLQFVSTTRHHQGLVLQSLVRSHSSHSSPRRHVSMALSPLVMYCIFVAAACSVSVFHYDEEITFLLLKVLVSLFHLLLYVCLVCKLYTIHTLWISAYIWTEPIVLTYVLNGVNKTYCYY